MHVGNVWGSPCSKARQSNAVAVAAAEEEREGEDSRDEDAASTAALEYMQSPSLLNSNAGHTASHSSMHDHAGSATDLEQREEPEQQLRASNELRQANVASVQGPAPVISAHEEQGKSPDCNHALHEA